MGSKEDYEKANQNYKEKGTAVRNDPNNTGKRIEYEKAKKERKFFGEKLRAERN
jgi:hypothetical protein